MSKEIKLFVNLGGSNNSALITRTNDSNFIVSLEPTNVKGISFEMLKI